MEGKKKELTFSDAASRKGTGGAATLLEVEASASASHT
jgi:hypothetical protein